MKIKYWILTIILLGVLQPDLNAQRRRRVPNNPSPNISLEELPCVAVDTINTSDPDTKIIVFSNNTWKYYRPTLSAQYDDLSVYRENWETSHVFAYRNVELTELPEFIELKLINDMDEFHIPIQGRVISPYGPRGRRNHKGVDIPLKTGEPIYAAFEGKVRHSSFNNGGFGNLVIVRHKNGLETWYAHLSKLNVEVNDYVKAGQIIGFGGNTGRSYGPHLHFEVRYKDQNFDPQFLFDFPLGLLKYSNFILDRSYLNIRSRATDELDEDEEFDPTMAILAAGHDESGETILERVERAEKEAEQAAKEQERIKQEQAKQYHTVRSGETLSSIAVKYKTTVTRLCQLNGITRNTKIQIGRRLRVR